MKKEEGRMQKANAPTRVLHLFFILPSSFCILLVRAYKFTLSPLIAFLAGPSGACRFEPSCSQYAIDALKTHGAVTGSALAAKRLCRCHPWGESGHDPVPSKLEFTQTRDKTRDRQTSVSVKEFLPLPKGEGRGEGERVARSGRSPFATTRSHKLNFSSLPVHHHGS